ncbi:RHS repeat domain-containing protein [Streptomyces sp. NPDC058145]|uniref:RHS repeat domain-containing protein n=1 Tax=Streptomyces sp. NPDC058145 TaxID=3346356 RepID=UPI0036F16887
MSCGVVGVARGGAGGRARNYDPAIGRFLTPDPIFQAGDPNQMGGYTYAADNPTSSSDPTGLDPASWGESPAPRQRRHSPATARPCRPGTRRAPASIRPPGLPRPQVFRPRPCCLPSPARRSVPASGPVGVFGTQGAQRDLSWSLPPSRCPMWLAGGFSPARPRPRLRPLQI